MLQNLKNKIIVSVQAMPNEPLWQEDALCAMIKSVVMGGASALRLAGHRDIKNAKKLYPNIPIIGITKPDVIPKNYKEVVYITPTIKDAKSVIEAGADIVALDATKRVRENNENLKDILDFIKENKRYAMADIATFEEGKCAIELGFDIVSTTLSGYTKETENNPDEPDFELCKKLSKITDIPIILEGKIWTPDDVKKAFENGAYSVVIGSAITRPQLITKRFIGALK